MQETAPLAPLFFFLSFFREISSTGDSIYGPAAPFPALEHDCPPALSVGPRPAADVFFLFLFLFLFTFLFILSYLIFLVYF